MLREILWRTGSGALAMAVGLFVVALPVRADVEWEKSSPYYEDDAWYDISEWFDGNDYNPTDETFGRIDDESYDAWQDEGTDQDNDYWYGYAGTAADDNWFYDYYDDGYADWYDFDADDVYDFSSRYYDYDHDGNYDAYTVYYDWDDDGIYEDFEYYSYNESGSQEQRQQARGDAPQDSKSHEVQGEITNVKQVQTSGGTQVLVGLKTNQGSQIFADLGSQEDLDSLDLEQGYDITIRGPKMKVGDKSVVVAKWIKADGKTTDINRQRASFQGKVAETRKVKVRGSEHLVAMLKTDDGKQRAIDLGPAKDLEADIQKGAQLEVRGARVKVKDKLLVMAHSVTVNGKEHPIQRRSQQARS